MGRLDARDVLPLQRHALDRGASAERPGYVRWDVSGSCQASRTMQSHASTYSRSDGVAAALQGDLMVPVTLDMEVPCRRCPNCLRFRARAWALRAQAEINGAVRTWFATLTLRPEAHYLMLLRAKHRLSARGVDFEVLSSDEQFAERHASVSEELTLWVKRLRKNSQSPLRLLLVAEAHKTGLPHYHGLIHEQDPDKPIKHALLAASWPHGFTKFKLVAPDEGARKTAWYVCKYLTKDQRARVRASLGYGKGSHEMHSKTDSEAPALGVPLRFNVETAPPKRGNPETQGPGSESLDPPVGAPRGD